MNRKLLLVAMAGLMLANTAPQFEDLSALESKASAAIAGPVQALDRRIRLPRCPENVVLQPAEPGVVAARCATLGWRLRIIALQATGGEASQAQPLAIKRGDGVELAIIGEGFELQTQGTALDDSAIGQSVRVKSLTNATILQAITTGSGVAEIRR